MAVVCLFALASRGRAQTVTAVTVAIAWVGSAALQNRQNRLDPEYAIFMLDVGALVVFTVLALRYRQGWQIGVTSFQLLTMATHIAVMIDLRISVLAYLTAYLVWSYLLLAALAWGGVVGFRQRPRPPT